MDRPMGSKQAKQQGKRVRSTLAEEIMPQILQNSSTVAAATQAIAAQGREAQNTLQSMLDFTILTTNTSGLDDATRGAIEARRLRIIARASREDEEF
ncbi:hypothetical protein DFH28DRAFT_905683 [Melampsora americana]|nr:hypothetical protein DFH28DRAFT_905683 [Melampsora americana]